MARSLTIASAAVRASPTSSAAVSSTRLKSARPTIPRVSALMSAATSNEVPVPTRGAQRSSIASVVSVIAVTKPARRAPRRIVAGICPPACCHVSRRRGRDSWLQ